MNFVIWSRAKKHGREIVGQVINWRDLNRNLVGHAGGPSGVYKVPDGAGGFNLMNSNASVVLISRWNALIANRPFGKRDFPQAAPNNYDLSSGIRMIG
ncbi:hypothetical protein RclHR1_00210024 [Rhizophagus clarus]|uniref:Uncharacterized protein n=1 Tax=Rhizophagus clarus TaxID=94130 RepID=A0A2Z6RL88_9GLOM|nr:hypothetical protein RclHR1_00210024 [Rhizophagus clarus]